MSEPNANPPPPEASGAVSGALQPAPRPAPAPCPWERDAAGYYLDPVTGRRVCGAKRRGAEAWCKAQPRTGMFRCRIHGGNTPRGMALPHYKGGFYSKHLPGPVRRLFEEARDDPDLMNLQDDVALFNAHLKELWSRLGTGESANGWGQLQELSSGLSGTMAELEASIRNGDPALLRQSVDALAASIRALRALVERAEGRQDAWAEIHDVQRQKVGTAVAEWRRQVDLKTLITAGDAMALIVAIMHSVKRNCADIRSQEAIAADISNFINIVRARPGLPAETIP